MSSLRTLVRSSPNVAQHGNDASVRIAPSQVRFNIAHAIAEYVINDRMLNIETR